MDFEGGRAEFTGKAQDVRWKMKPKEPLTFDLFVIRPSKLNRLNTNYHTVVVELSDENHNE